MSKTRLDRPSTPLPTLLIVALALPTFYVFAAGVALIVWAVGAALSGGLGRPPAALKQFVVPALYATGVLWAIYAVWIAWCKDLTAGRKVKWLLAITAGNMIAMAVFWVAVGRRYIKPSPRPGPDQPSCQASTSCKACERFL